MLHRLTLTECYWRQGFSVGPGDLEYINNLLLEEERPLAIEALTRAVIRHRVEQEEAALQEMLAKGLVYQPSETYQVGETLVFPALKLSTGSVTALRPGHNPEYGQFQVAEVEFEGTGKRREFAAALEHPHPLNDETNRLLHGDGSQRTVDRLYEEHHRSVIETLSQALEEQTDLVQLFGLWFVKALATEIGPGYLNIAEAMLDMAHGGPLSTPELLADLDLPAESRAELLDFSLNYALFQDERFDEVGPAGQVLWYLSRLEPAAVLEPPERLAYQPAEYDRGLLNLNLRKLEQELDDEWSVGWEPDETPGPVAFTLTFLHRQQGTLPLSSKIAPLFPTSYQAPRIRCTIIDSHSGDEMEAWVVWRGRFVCGLADWYQENDLPVGAYLHLSPGPTPGTAIAEYEARRAQSEWVRVVQVENGRLVFGMQKRSIGCRYDDMMMIGVDDLGAPDAVWRKAQAQGWSLAEVLVGLFPELARLSPQKTVHAKTLYSAANMVRRCPPGPIFAELVKHPCFISMGENYWRFNPQLWTGA